MISLVSEGDYGSAEHVHAEHSGLDYGATKEPNNTERPDKPETTGHSLYII